MTIPPPSAPPPFSPPPSAGQTGLVLDLRKPVGSVGMMSPVLAIDGHPAQVVWGPNFYPAPPGRRHLRVTTRYLWEYGGAEADVDVVPGQTSVLHYTRRGSSSSPAGSGRVRSHGAGPPSSGCC